MTQPLFLRTPEPHEVYTSTLDKEAARDRLPPDPQTWAQVIYQKAIEKLPELTNFQLDVVLDHQDMPSSTALGAVQIMLKQAPQLDAMGMPRPQPPGRVARIPVLIQRGELYPLDLLIAPAANGEGAKHLPLTSRRLQQAMFRDDIFDGTSHPPGNTGIGGFLYPSNRDTFYGGNSSLQFKEASLLGDLLSQSKEAVRSLRSKVASVESFSNNPGAAPVLALLLNPPAPEVKISSDLLQETLTPTVVQILDLHDGRYLLKTANRMAWDPHEEILGRAELLRLAKDLPPEILHDLDTSGGITLGTGEESGFSEDDVPNPQPKVLDQAGIAKVRHQGKELVGYFLPNLIDLSGTYLPIALFTNGSVFSLASEIEGLPISGEPPSLPSGPPEGKGLFFFRDNHRLMATIPMEILARTASDFEGEGFLVATDDGSEGTVKLQPGLRKPVEVDGTLLLPDTFQWMPLNGLEEVDLDTHEPTPTDKVASACRVEIRGFGSGSEVSLSGPPLSKLGGELHGQPSEALFTLVGLGVPPLLASEKIAEAMFRGKVSMMVPYQLIPLNDTLHHLQAKVAKAVPVGVNTPQAPDLIKEAAIMQDPESIDTLLGLSLLTPDNIATFTAHLPELERCQQLACEMLLASRLGLRELPEAALEKMVKSLEEVIEACYQIRFQQEAVALQASHGTLSLVSFVHDPRQSLQALPQGPAGAGLVHPEG